MTSKRRYGDYSDEQRELRRDILREAHNLIGTVTHLLDLCDVELVREVRLPEYSRDFNKPDRRGEILRRLAKVITIASRYGEFNAEKILFESRETKRKFALCAPDIDLDDPTGEHVGSWTIVGQFGETAEGFLSALERRLQEPGELQVDATSYTDFEVELETRLVDDRPAYRTAIERLLEAKQIESSEEAVAWLHGLTGSFYDIADALRWLGKEDHREVESRDLIYALSRLPAEQLVPDAKPTVGMMIEVLLEAAVDDAGPLTKREIAERGGISERSVYDARHWAVLEELGVVRSVEDGWVISLALPSDRDEPQLPMWIEDSLANRRDVLMEIEQLMAQAATDYLHDPPPTHLALRWPPDYEELFEIWPWIEPWAEVADKLLNEGGR